MAKLMQFQRGELGNNYQASLNKDLMTIAKKDFHETLAFSVDPSNPLLLKKLNQAILEQTKNGKVTYDMWLKNNMIDL